jgi:3'(2'), 5'-bisphosphate nucleotidase
MIDYLQTALRAAIDAGAAALEMQYSKKHTRQKADNTPVSDADLKANDIIIEQLAGFGLPILSEESARDTHQKRREWDLFWMIDPIDGTSAYLKGGDEYTINIALIRRHEPVLGVVFAPASAQLWYGVKNTGAFKHRVKDGKVSASKILKESENLPLQKNDKPVVIVTKSHMNPATCSLIEEVKQIYPDAEVKQEGSSLKFCRLAEGSADIHLRSGKVHEWDAAAGDAVLRASGGITLREMGDEPLQYNSETLEVSSLYATSANYRQ